MPASSPIFVANLGTQTISVGRFLSTANGGLILDGYETSEVLGDPAADSTRVSQAQFAIGEAAGRLGLKSGPAIFAVSGQSVFARLVKLPSVGEEKVEQIVRYEAQQNVPFPIDEVVWDYQIVSGQSSASSQMEVVLVAIKADLLDELNSAIEGNGFKTRIVDVASAALYNAFRYNYSDLEGCSLLIDLGSRSTNLIFIEPGKVFLRSIAVGGSTITSALAKELDENFVAAESRKRAQGFVSLGGAYAEPSDPVVARMSKIIRNTMTRIHAEIGRSISFFKSQQGGAAPQRAFLCGGSASLPYMREFFQEKLQIPIEFYNPLRNVAVSKKVALEAAAKDAHTLGELVGLALRAENSCPIELNLRPSSVVQAQAMAAQKPFLLAAGFGLLATLAGWWVYFDKSASIKEDVVASVSAKVSELARYEKRFDQLERDRETLQIKAAQLVQVASDRGFFLAVIDEIAQRIPEDGLWVTQFRPTSGGAVVDAAGGVSRIAERAGAGPVANPLGGQASRPRPGAPAESASRAAEPAIDGIQLTGLYLVDLENPADSERIVHQFARALEKSEYFDFDYNTQQRSVLRRVDAPDDQAWAFGFELQLPLSNPVPIPQR